MAEVQAVSFRNRDGLVLFGTLHRPAGGSVDLPAVLLLSPGAKMRVGPGRLYLPLTDMLTAEGYTVLRFDFFGLGDSAGDLEESLMSDVYNHIQVGRYVNDTLDAMEWMRREHGCSQFILGGLCGGAITGILAAERDPGVVGLLSVGMALTLASNAATPARYLTRAQLDASRGRYFRRLFQPKSWWRFLTFQSEYGVIWRSMLRLLKRSSKPPSVPTGDAATQQRGNVNPLLPPAIFAFLERGGRALMLFSQRDGLHSEYEEKFVEPFAQRLRPLLPQVQLHVVAEANHVLSLREWQQEMVETSRGWITSLSHRGADRS